MARDQTNKALSLARDIVDATDSLVQAIEAAERLHSERTDSAINLATYEADYAANDDLAHVEGNDLNAATNIANALLAYIEATEYQSSGFTIKQILQVVRP